MITDRCYYCGKKIFLKKVARAYRWIDNPTKPDSITCKGGPILNMPHAPKELFYAENRAREVSQDDTKQSGGNKTPETEI